MIDSTPSGLQPQVSSRGSDWRGWQRRGELGVYGGSEMGRHPLMWLPPGHIVAMETAYRAGEVVVPAGFGVSLGHGPI